MTNKKSHKNKAKVDCYWCVGVLRGRNEIKFVTKVEYKPKNAHWADGEKPMYFDSKTEADEIAYGLCLNGYPAMVVEFPDFFEVENPINDKPEKPVEKIFNDDRFIQKVCPNCESSEIRKGDKFCKDCGQELDWE